MHRDRSRVAWVLRKGVSRVKQREHRLCYYAFNVEANRLEIPRRKAIRSNLAATNIKNTNNKV